MPTSCYYPSRCFCCLGQVEYLTESRAKFVLTAWLSVLDVPFPLPLSTTVCHWVRSIILICCACMFYEVSVLSILSPNEFIRPNLKWQPIVAIFGGGNPRLFSSLYCILACNSLWIHMTLLKNEEPTQNAIYRKLQSKGHSATERHKAREREGYYMNEQCGEGGGNFALSAYGTICRRDEVKQMSREIAKGL